MATIKVLQLEPWMEKSFKDDQQELFEMGYTETTPRFNRNGWYKHIGLSWFEINGRAFYHPDMTWLADDFDSCLKQLNHRPLTRKQRNEIRSLIHNRLAPRSLKELYYTDTDWYSIRSTRRMAGWPLMRNWQKRRKHNA